MFIAVPITAVLKIICQNIPALKPIAMMMENGREGCEKQKILLTAVAVLNFALKVFEKMILN